jgi:hypothetical protein
VSVIVVSVSVVVLSMEVLDSEVVVSVGELAVVRVVVALVPDVVLIATLVVASAQTQVDSHVSSSGSGSQDMESTQSSPASQSAALKHSDRSLGNVV